MDVRQFLTSAQILMQGGSEIDYRNAASRAYYCAFHLCNLLVKTLPISPDNITSHQKIIDALAHSHDKRLKSLANKLKVVRELRHKADYKLDMKFTRCQPRLVSKRFLRKLKSFCNPCRIKMDYNNSIILRGIVISYQLSASKGQPQGIAPTINQCYY